MVKKRLIIGVCALVIAVLAGIIYFRSKPESFSSFRGKREFNCILITVDTLRADRVGCYGFKEIETPFMDLFAQRGVKFERCISQTPLTLPSHTSIMTGTYPTFHGVRDNGGFLVPQELVTLAELFKEKNYKTAAFVAAYVLDSKWGLNQGFETYFDQFDLSRYKSISLGNVQRRADEVIDQVLDWLEKNSQEKFFTWIHLYDPHTPYDPPSPFKEKYANRPYAGEIAYADSQLGRLWHYLEEKGLNDETLLVFASDHGESLGEHGEDTHGFFVYQEGIHVPLIFVTPFAKFQGLSRSNVVSLVDVMPTILELEGMSIPSQVQGQSLVSLFDGEGKGMRNFAYSETYYPRFHYGWSDLKCIQEDRFKLIVAPDLELYDLEKDPEERQNLASLQAETTRRLMGVADQFLEESERGSFKMDYRHIDEEARQRLTALGYIGNFADPISLEGKRLGDPKEKIQVFNQISHVKEMMLDERLEDAVAMIQDIIAKDPEVVDAYFTLGNIYFKQKEFAKAVESFKKVLEIKPGDVFTFINITNSYVSMGDLDEAERFLSSIIDTVPPDSQLYLIMGNIENEKGKYKEALRYYDECIKLNPSSASAYSAYGGILIVQGHLDEAEPYLERALERNTQLIKLHYNYALLFEGRGDFVRAMDEYKQELQNNPYDYKSAFNLSRLYRKQGDDREEENYLRKTLEINPGFPMAYFFLARLNLNRGVEYEQAISLVNKGIELKPDKKDLPLGYFLLADIYSRLGNSIKAEEYARKGRELTQAIK